MATTFDLPAGQDVKSSGWYSPDSVGVSRAFARRVRRQDRDRVRRPPVDL